MEASMKVSERLACSCAARGHEISSATAVSFVLTLTQATRQSVYKPISNHNYGLVSLPEQLDRRLFWYRYTTKTRWAEYLSYPNITQLTMSVIAPTCSTLVTSSPSFEIVTHKKLLSTCLYAHFQYIPLILSCLVPPSVVPHTALCNSRACKKAHK